MELGMPWVLAGGYCAGYDLGASRGIQSCACPGCLQGGTMLGVTWVLARGYRAGHTLGASGAGGHGTGHALRVSRGR